MQQNKGKWVTGAVLAAIFFLGWRFLLPPALPFLAGLGLALAAEPLTALLCRRLNWKRGAGAFVGVTVTVLLLMGLAVLAVSLLLRQLSRLAAIAPDLEDTARQGLQTAQDWLLSLAQNAPEGMRTLLTRSVLGLFDSGGTLYTQALAQLPRIATGFLSTLTGSAFGIGTGLLAAYLFSARLPRLKDWFLRRIPERWRSRYLPTLQALRSAMGGWFRAQLMLMGVTFVILWAGFALLGIRHATVWAAITALIDAVPMLGTGLVLIPWSLVLFLRRQTVRALGMLALTGIAILSRSLLEPRLLGKQLGLDPLVTLAAMYAGFQFLGLAGLIGAPLVAVTAAQVARSIPGEGRSS